MLAVSSFPVVKLGMGWFLGHCTYSRVRGTFSSYELVLWGLFSDGSPESALHSAYIFTLPSCVQLRAARGKMNSLHVAIGLANGYLPDQK